MTLHLGNDMRITLSGAAVDGAAPSVATVVAWDLYAVTSPPWVVPPVETLLGTGSAALVAGAWTAVIDQAVFSSRRAGSKGRLAVRFADAGADGEFGGAPVLFDRRGTT